MHFRGSTSVVIKISWQWQSVKLLLKYGDFSICQNGGGLPSWIVKNLKCYLAVILKGSKCVTFSCSWKKQK